MCDSALVITDSGSIQEKKARLPKDGLEHWLTQEV